MRPSERFQFSCKWKLSLKVSVGTSVYFGASENACMHNLEKKKTNVVFFFQCVSFFLGIFTTKQQVFWGDCPALVLDLLRVSSWWYGAVWLSINSRAYSHAHCLLQTAITNAAPPPSLISEHAFHLGFSTHQTKTSTNHFACFRSHVSYNDGDPHRRYCGEKTAPSVCLGKPMRAAACETKQPSHLCPCFLSVVVGIVAKDCH